MITASVMKGLKTEYSHFSSKVFLFSYNAFYCEGKVLGNAKNFNFSKNAKKICKFKSNQKQIRNKWIGSSRKLKVFLYKMKVA